jgi:hypothetical protein
MRLIKMPKAKPKYRKLVGLGAIGPALRRAAAGDIAIEALKKCAEHTEPEELMDMVHKKMGELIKELKSPSKGRRAI